MNLSDKEAFDFLGTMFPGGLKDPALIAELCPGGWENSPLFACFHPSPEQRYREDLDFSRNLRALTAGMRKRKAGDADPAPEEPTMSYGEFLAKHPEESPELTDKDRIGEPAELIGLCLWDVFSDNHDVVAADDRTVHLGSFRGSAGMISDFMDGYAAGEDADPWDDKRGMGYMDFYMGTWGISRRADLSPVYEMIFRRLKALGADWRYSFPRIHLIDFGGAAGDGDKPYDPSEGFEKEQARRAREKELRAMRRKMDLDVVAAKREARATELPATVRAYQEVYGKFPAGWPPDPYDPD